MFGLRKNKFLYFKMAKIRPIYLMHQEGLLPNEKRAVVDGVRDLVSLAGIQGMELVDLGVWRQKDFLNPNGTLKEYSSADWYIEMGRKYGRRKQLNGGSMLNCLAFEPWRDPKQGGKEHYDVLIVNEDMFDRGTNFVIGLASSGIGTVISTYQFRELKERLKSECIKTEAMHEFGHVLSLPDETRGKNLVKSLGDHCSNRCIMRQGLVLPKDWINITEDRLKYGPLCPDCREDLDRYFSTD
jgi:predicted Zn-dependent protease